MITKGSELFRPLPFLVVSQLIISPPDNRLGLSNDSCCLNKKIVKLRLVNTY